MESLYRLIILLSLFNVGQAVLQIVPLRSASYFPSCGINCAAFQQAQGACGSQTPNLAAENCFCQFSQVQPFYSSPDNVCANECSSAGDRGVLKYWFTNFCAQVGAGKDPLATSTQTNSAPSPTVTFVGGAPDTSHETGTAWLKTHWKWILMVGILLIGLIAIGLTFRWLRNRHQRKVAERTKKSSKRASSRLSELLMSPSEKPRAAPKPGQHDMWGPHQHMAASQGFAYDMEHGTYPDRGARPDSWQSDGKGFAKSNGSQVRVTEVPDMQADPNYHATEVNRVRNADENDAGDRIRPAGRN